MSAYEDQHKIALARELTYAAGCPLRDRYGFAASDETVLAIVNVVFRQPDDKAAANEIGGWNLVGEIEFAMGCEEFPDEDYEQQIIRALRPLAEQRRDAAGTALS